MDRPKQKAVVFVLNPAALFSFTLYVVFAYGFHFGKGNPFNLILDSPRRIISHEVIFNSSRVYSLSS